MREKASLPLTKSYYTDDKLFETNAETILCPPEIKVATDCEVVEDIVPVPIPSKWHYFMIKKEDLKDGDLIFVESFEYPDRLYCKGYFYPLTPEAYDLGPAIGKFDKIYAPKKEKRK